MNMWIKIVDIAEQLDKAGLYKEADTLTGVLVRTAYYYPGTNFPMENRVITDSDAIWDEAEEAEKSRLKSPRYNPKTKEFVKDPEDETEALEGGISSMNAEQTSGITNVVYDPYAVSNNPDSDKWSLENKDAGGRGYERYSPHPY
jgi:hypothetical protein